MTCIIGLIDKGAVYIGGDTFASNMYHGYQSMHSKVFKVGDFVIGGTTSFRMLDLLEYSFKPSRLVYEKEDIDTYMRTVFINSVMSCLEAGGFQQIDKGAKVGGTFLVGYKDKLFLVQSDFSVINRSPFATVGSGTEVAWGSLYTSEGLKMAPEDRITKALDAASQFVTSVRGPYNILSTGENKA